MVAGAIATVKVRGKKSFFLKLKFIGTSYKASHVSNVQNKENCLIGRHPP